MSNPALKIFPALIVAITALVAQPLFGAAVAPHQLVITEYSSTSLTATYDGTSLSVDSAGADDNWVFNLPFVPSTLTTTFVQWAEPENATLDPNGLWNFALFGFLDSIPQRVSVGSDAPFSDFATTVANNTGVNIGTDPGDGVPIIATFNDLGDVPDTGTNASLFGLSLAGLAFLRRKLC